MNLKSLTILTGYEYFSEITEKIAATKRGDRVGLMSMSVDPTEQRTKPLFREVIAAAKRGVTVQVNVDAHSFMIDDAKTFPSGPILKYYDSGRSRRADYRAKFGMLENLRANGGHYCITNMPERRLSNPFSGRSHIKLCIINDTTYIGGSNLSKSWQVDLMVRLKDSKSADFAFDFMQRVSRAGNVREAMSGNDVTFRVDDATDIFIDAGRKKQSLIYARALNFIDEAKHWVMMSCQFFPGKPTSEHLAAALNRKAQVDVYYQASRVSLDFLSVPHYVVEFGDKMKYPKQLFAHPVGKNIPRLHAKLIATEQGAMIGSHNYVTQGVGFGTAEIMLFRRDPAFAKEAAAKLKNSLDEARIDKSNPSF